ncbi:hypothetical protein KEM44_13815 (plasmid) [Sinorhizobium meliloti]|nr:hypothetical protein KEM44_13815 [Sinorhizobium meliloti]
MVQDLSTLKETASQTAGPYVHIGLTPNFCGIGGVYEGDLGASMVNDKTLGQRITVTGRVIDGAGMPLRDALLEIWQADAAGLYNSPSELRGTADPNFTGWGRSPTSDEDGRLHFRDGEAGPRSIPRRPADGPAYQLLDRRARHQYRPPHAHVFPRRGGGERRRSAACPHRAPPPGRDACRGGSGA